MTDVDDLQRIAIGSSRLQAEFVSAAGMVCCSLRHDGAQLLSPRNGVRAYAQRGSTMGIPLLYPWANRLAALRYPGPHGDVALARDNPLLKLDGNGLPIHGAIAGALPWELVSAGKDAGGEGEDRLRARLRWQRADLLAIFPFAHVLELRAQVDGAMLTIETSVRAPADAPVPLPVSFGYHPYLTLPATDRRDWRVELPANRRLLLDDRMIPTGVSETFDRHSFRLVDSGWDDAFADLDRPAVFAVSGGGRRIELRLGDGYSHAQVYAPPGEPFICFEPMTAPTNALVSREALPVVEPGGEFVATFSVSVSTE